MQKNWLIYLIAVAVILLCLVFLYCVIRYYLSRQNNSSTANLVKLATVISGKKNEILSGQVALSPGKLLSSILVPDADLNF
jgi:hypothetical protein